MHCIAASCRNDSVDSIPVSRESRSNQVIGFALNALFRSFGSTNFGNRIVLSLFFPQNYAIHGIAEGLTYAVRTRHSHKQSVRVCSHRYVPVRTGRCKLFIPVMLA